MEKFINLRIAIAGGGCSCFQYGMSLEQAKNENYTVLNTVGDAADRFLSAKSLVIRANEKRSFAVHKMYRTKLKKLKRAASGSNAPATMC